MKSLFELVKSLYGPTAISSTLGTRTNVVRLPSGKLQRYLSTDLNIEAASDAAAKNAYNEMQQLIPDIPKMNDAEKLIFEGNLRRLKNKLEASNLIKAGEVPSGITGLEPKITQLKDAAKRLEEATGKKINLNDILKEYGTSLESFSASRMQDEGLVRATARQILINDIRAGKIKNITVSEAINMKEPIDPFRQIYGEDALEQLDSLIPNFRNLKTEMEAEKFARSKFKFEPNETRPKGSYTQEEMDKILKETQSESKGLDYLMGLETKKKPEIINIKSEADKRKTIDELIDEYNANQDRLLLTDEEGGTLIGYQEFNKIKNRNEEIAKVLEEKGISSKPETKPEGEVIPFRKKPTEPEGKAEGGRIGFKTGGGKKILDIIKKANEELKVKKSIEKVNPKTGEVTTPTEPVKTAETKTIDYDAMNAANELSLKHKEAAYAFDQIQPIDIYDKIAADRVAEIMAEIKGKDYYDLSQKQRSVLYKKAQSFLDEYIKIDRINKAVKKFNAGEELQAMDKRYLSKFFPESGVTFESKVKPPYKQGDIITEENFGNTPFAPSQETLDNLEKARKMSSEMSLEQRMNKVLNQYDKSMFIKNEQGMVDVTNPQNVEKMALLLKRDHPEIYNEIFNLTEDLSQKQQLLDFDVTGRKPNARGGLNYLMGL